MTTDGRQLLNFEMILVLGCTRVPEVFTEENFAYAWPTKSIRWSPTSQSDYNWRSSLSLISDQDCTNIALRPLGEAIIVPKDNKFFSSSSMRADPGEIFDFSVMPQKLQEFRNYTEASLLTHVTALVKHGDYYL